MMVIISRALGIHRVPYESVRNKDKRQHNEHEENQLFFPLASRGTIGGGDWWRVVHPSATVCPAHRSIIWTK